MGQISREIWRTSSWTSRILENASSTGIRGGSKKKDRTSGKIGNGWLGEIVEWACRTYKWRIDYVLYEVPAIHIAMLWRCFAQGVGGLESGTLLEAEIAQLLKKAGEVRWQGKIK